MIPVCFLKNKPNPPWTEKSYRLTKFQSKLSKNLADEQVASTAVIGTGSWAGVDKTSRAGKTRSEENA